MARITDLEFDLMHSAVTEWKYRFDQTIAKFYEGNGIDRSKWDKDTVELHAEYMEELQNIMKAESTVWVTLYNLRNEVDE